MPVVVGGDSGIAAAMTYEAKKLGIHRAMPIFKIRKLYPEVVVLDHHFELYRKISDEMFRILSSYLDTVERYSIDECFAVVTPADIAFYGGAEKMVAGIKREVQDTLGVTYSFGLARTKALAKTASKLRKPDGAVCLLSVEDERAALAATSIKNIWGIGWRTTPRFINRGLRPALDFIEMDMQELSHYFSEPLVHLHRELSGTPVFDVISESDPRGQKSMQSTGTFRPASTDPKYIWAELSGNVERACRRARRLGLLSKKVSFFVKSSEFKYRHAEVKLPLYTADPGFVLNSIEHAFYPVLIPGERIRATGATLLDLVREEDVQRDLFGVQETSIGKLAVEAAADAMRAKYGNTAVRRASSLTASKGHFDSSFHRPQNI